MLITVVNTLMYLLLTLKALTTMTIRDKLLKKFIKAKDVDNKKILHDKYKSYRNSITNLLRLSKKNHYQNYFQSNIDNTKKTWEGINEIINKKKKDEQNIVLNKDSKKITNPLDISNEFNLFFSTIANKIQMQIPSNRNFANYIKKNRSPDSFFFTPGTKDEVLKIFRSLDHSKSTGDYSIPKQLFNCIPDNLANILKDILNLTFQTGIFPSSLKTIKVIPIFKNKGSNPSVDNYRPISLLSNIDKIFEKLVYSRVSSYLDQHQILSDRQFGFRKKHSTQLALISLTEEIRKSLDSGKFSCGIFIDLQKVLIQ